MKIKNQKFIYKSMAKLVLSVAAVPTSFIFTQDLHVGMNTPDVQNLQRVLNSSVSTVVSSAGTGSKGLEGTYFGYLTQDAVKRFQALYRDEILKPAGLNAPSGIVGSLTRKKLNSLLAISNQVIIPTPLSSLGNTTTATSTANISDPTNGTGVFPDNSLFEIFSKGAQSVGIDLRTMAGSAALAVESVHLIKSSPFNAMGGNVTIEAAGSGFENNNTIYSGLGILENIPSTDSTNLQFKIQDLPGYKVMASYPAYSGKTISIFYHVGNTKGVGRDTGYFNLTFK